MRPRQIISLILALLLTPVLSSVGEDAQVIQSPQSVLTIYSYGSGDTARQFAPEAIDRPSDTAALSDVVTTPPLSTSVPVPSQTLTAETGFGSTNPISTFTGVKTSNPISGTSTMQSSLTRLPVMPAMISVGWLPSPDPSVVGYNLYTGPSSHRYTLKQSLGNQMTAQLPANQGALYIAVSAYTAEGFESQLSDELTVLSPSTQDTSTTSEFTGAGGNSY